MPFLLFCLTPACLILVACRAVTVRPYGAVVTNFGNRKLEVFACCYGDFTLPTLQLTWEKCSSSLRTQRICDACPACANNPLRVGYDQRFFIALRISRPRTADDWSLVSTLDYRHGRGESEGTVRGLTGQWYIADYFLCLDHRGFQPGQSVLSTQHTICPLIVGCAMVWRRWALDFQDDGRQASYN